MKIYLAGLSVCLALLVAYSGWCVHVLDGNINDSDVAANYNYNALDSRIHRLSGRTYQLRDRLVGVEAKFPDKFTYVDLAKVSVRVDVGGGSGTGVFVTRRVGNVYRTYVWTAGHVAAALRNADGTFRPATIYQETREDGLLTGVVKTEAKVIAYSDADVGDDLALLEIEKDNFCYANAEFVQCDKPEDIGTELIHVGCTLGLYNSSSRGVMSQTDRDLLKTGKVFDQSSCIGYPGSSGGGVYRLDGQCIGLLVRGAGAGLNFIVPVRRMRVWAEKMGVSWSLNSDLPVPVARAQTPIDDGATKSPAQDDSYTTTDKRIKSYR